ncbi:inositol monophosphatase family protein [Rhodovulum steppense]|uniref:Myo-inositol-1(Or 4)-monophosphatase n=1 Tax=Rhodovulum steppense TaxID=540251 RepID=A0A4R1YU45_9RHOB|nr:inositol monophosphatase family protein [Rhodovulum steppense]TCM84609.1 myo-inositol-1(or 4)-monophosphatase [Rhodovulum steppense]
MPRFDSDELIATAHALADAARAATLARFRAAALGVENKAGAGFDPVTLADREAEAAMRAVLAERRPDDAILGEELAGVAGSSGLTWVLDPVDGTRSFMCGTPTWGVLIAVADESGPFFGLIDQPYIGERFLGGLGLAELQARTGRHPLQTRAPRPLAEASLFTTFPEIGSPEEARAFAALAGQVRLTRYGLDCYAYALVALGQIDLVVEAGLQAYDVQAPIAVIEAAGGIVTDWRGGSAHQGGRVLAAANRAVHAEALAILSRAPD